MVPRLYYVPEGELVEDIAASGSFLTLKDVPMYKMEALVEEIPFQWAQSLYLITRLTSMSCDVCVFANSKMNHVR